MPEGQQSPGPRTRPVLAAALGLLVLGALAFAIVASKGSSEHGSTTATGSEEVATSTQTAITTGAGGFVGAELPGHRPAPPIALTDQYGRPVSLSQFRGQPVVIAFAYTRCGSQCTLIAQQIRGALNELAKPVPVLLISGDPATDTPAAVREFLASVSLSGRVYYLTGTVEQLRPIWRAYRVTPASAGRQAFDASAQVMLVDRAGDERVLYSVEQLTPEAISHDVGKLQEGPPTP